MPVLKKKLEEFSAGREIKLYEISRDQIFKGKFDRLYNSKKFHSYICIICKYMMHKKAADIAESENALGIRFASCWAWFGLTGR